MSSRETAPDEMGRLFVVRNWICNFPEVDREAAYAVSEKLRQPQQTLVPGYLLPSGRRYFVLLKRDLAEMNSLGWIPNSALTNDLNFLNDCDLYIIRIIADTDEFETHVH